MFKSLLFFGAGAVLAATGERDMERLGGLIHRMPRTAVAFLIGCVAISALPPLNGFVSEWLTFQAILVSPQLPQWGLKLMVPGGRRAARAVGGARGGLFRQGLRRDLPRPAAHARRRGRAGGRPFLARRHVHPRGALLPRRRAAGLRDRSRWRRWCKAWSAARMPAQAGLPWLSIVPIAESRSSYNGLIILVFLMCSGTLTAMFIHRFATRATRRSAIWDCGYPDPSPATQYTSSSFAMPIRRVFGTTVFEVREKVDMPRPGETRAGRFHVKVLDPAWRLAYGPLARAVNRVATRLNRLQFLTIRRYLTLVFSALIVLLLVVAAWR